MDRQWLGYLRAGGAKGIRNKLLVLYTVECASFVAREIARRAPGDVDVIGFSGCTDNEYAIRLLAALARHPNVGGVLAVGLGCEYTQAGRLAQMARDSGRAAAFCLIQEAGGTRGAIEKGLALARELHRALADTPRAPMTLADLTVGAECGGSDSTSGLSGNVTVGRFFDMLVDAGGTAVFEEIVEAVGLLPMLERRAASEQARAQLAKTYQKAMDYCRAVRQYSVSPGNFAGGLTTIEEKSMGALAKSGSRPIQGVLKVGQRPPGKGLWLLDTTPDPHYMQFGITNPNDNEGLTALAASGCQLMFLVTGRGNVVGNAVAPVVKVTGNSRTFARMREDMDFDAGRAFLCECSQEALARELAQLVRAVAAGEPTCAERLGHSEYCIPYKYQDAPPACRAGKE